MHAPPRPLTDPLGAALEPYETLVVVPWVDPVVERLGADPLGSYLELFWLPILGPSATLLLRHLARRFTVEPKGFRLDQEQTARALGLGGMNARHSPFRRAIGRCVRYAMARPAGRVILAVRQAVAPLPVALARRLPASLQEAHRAWVAREDPDGRDPGEGPRAAGGLPPATPASGPRRLGTPPARDPEILAAALLEQGWAPDWIEGVLVRRGVHPARAYEAVRAVPGGPPASGTKDAASSTKVRTPKAVPPLAT